MALSWYQVRSIGWWALGIFFFFMLELMLRIKLGSIFALAAVWALCHQGLAARFGQTGEESPARRFYLALYAGLIICAAIFLGFGVLNIACRTYNPAWRWFQLP